MLRAATETPLAILAIPSVSAAGAEIVTVVAKRTFTIEGTGVRQAAEQAPVRTIDEPWDARDPKSGVRLASGAVPEIAANVSPAEAWARALQWQQEQQAKAQACG